MAEKSLKIESKFDSKDLDKLNRSLKDIGKSGEKLGTTLGNLSKSFKSLSTVLNTESKAFDKFKNVIKDIESSISNQNKQLKSYIQNLQSVRGLGGAAVSSSTSSSMAGNFAYAGAGGGNNIIPPMSGGPGGGAALPPMRGGAQLLPLPGGGFVVVPPGNQGPSGGGRNNNMLRTFKTGSYFTDFAQNTFQTAQSMKLAPLENMAAIQGFSGNLYKNLGRGDISDLLALMHAQSRGVKLDDLAGGRFDLIMQAMSGNMTKALQSTPGGPVGALTGGLSAAFDMLTAGGSGKFDALEAQNLSRGLDLIKQQQPQMFEQFSTFMGLAPTLMQGNRRLGGRAIGAAGSMGGIGMGLQERISFLTNLADQFGQTAALGGVPTGKIVPTGHEVQTPEFKQALSQSIVGAVNFKGRKYMPGMGPEMSQGLGQFAAQMAQFGFDPSVMANLAGQLGSRNMSNSTSGAMSGARKVLEEILSDAVKHGVSDGITEPQTLEVLAKAVGSSMIANATTEGGRALGGLLTAGLTDQTASPFMIQQRAAGLQQLGNALQDNPLLQLHALQRAKNLLGAGSDAVSVKALGGANLLQLLNDRTLDIMFPGDQGRALRNKEFQGGLNDLLTVLTNGSGPQSQRLKGMLGDEGILGLGVSDSSGNFPAAALTAALARQKLAGFKNIDQTTLERILQAAAAFQAGGGFNGTAVDGTTDFRKYLDKRGGLAAAAVDAGATGQIKELTDMLSKPEFVKNISIGFGKVGDFMKVATNIPQNENWNAARLTIVEFEKLVDKLANLGPDKVKNAGGRLQAGVKQ